MNTVRPNQKRAKIAITLLWIAFSFTIIEIVSSYFQIRLLEDFKRGQIDIQAANSNDRRQLIVVLISAVILLIAGITFIQWFRRAYYNLNAAGEKTEYTDGWAAGAWFVPIMNLFRPYQIMIELYDKTKRRLLEKNLISTTALNNRSLIIYWWILWVSVSIGTRIITQLTKNETGIQELINLTWAEIVMSVLQLLGAILIIKIVKDYSQVEHLLSNDGTGSRWEKLPDTNDTILDDWESFPVHE